MLEKSKGIMFQKKKTNVQIGNDVFDDVCEV
jgi:hypothetical protein